MATSLGVLIVVLDFTGVSREEFDAWYDTEHIPERQRVPGFRSAQRWLSADGIRCRLRSTILMRSKYSRARRIVPLRVTIYLRGPNA